MLSAAISDSDGQEVAYVPIAAFHNKVVSCALHRRRKSFVSDCVASDAGARRGPGRTGRHSGVTGRRGQKRRLFCPPF